MLLPNSSRLELGAIPDSAGSSVAGPPLFSDGASFVGLFSGEDDENSLKTHKFRLVLYYGLRSRSCSVIHTIFSASSFFCHRFPEHLGVPTDRSVTQEGPDCLIQAPWFQIPQPLFSSPPKIQIQATTQSKIRGKPFSLGVASMLSTYG